MNGYGYLTIIGTSPARQGQGLGSALLRRMQAMAGARPIWLEASSAGSRRLYERHGFVVVEEVVVGRGRVGADGLAKGAGVEGEGEGVTFWAMVWRREEPEEGEMEEELGGLRGGGGKVVNERVVQAYLGGDGVPQFLCRT